MCTYSYCWFAYCHGASSFVSCSLHTHPHEPDGWRASREPEKWRDQTMMGIAAKVASFFGGRGTGGPSSYRHKPSWTPPMLWEDESFRGTDIAKDAIIGPSALPRSSLGLKDQHPIEELNLPHIHPQQCGLLTTLLSASGKTVHVVSVWAAMYLALGQSWLSQSFLGTTNPDQSKWMHPYSRNQHSTSRLIYQAG